MALMPNAAQCRVEESKIRVYLLNPQHKDGKSKEKFFAAMGFRVEAWTTLRDALCQHPISNFLTRTTHNEHGTKYEVTCSVVTPNGRNPCIVTIWIEDGSGGPKFVTAYPKSV